LEGFSKQFTSVAVREFAENGLWMFAINQNLGLSLEQLSNWRAVSWCISRNILEYSSSITRTFVMNSVIGVAISHTLSGNYLNSNESPGGTPGCNGGILLKIHNLHWSHAYKKDANMMAIGK
jgi:hypothetical protein